MEKLISVSAYFWQWCRYSYALFTNTTKQCSLLLCSLDNVAPCLSTCWKLLTIYLPSWSTHARAQTTSVQKEGSVFLSCTSCTVPSSTLSSASQIAAAYLSLIHLQLCSQTLPSIHIAEGAVHSLTCLLRRLGDCRSLCPQRKTAFLAYPLP